MRRGLRAVSLFAALLAASPVLAQRPEGGVPVAAGTQLEIILQTGLNSGVAKLDQRFEAVTLLDLRVGDVVVIPARSVVRGFVSSVRASTSSDRKGTLTLSFEEILVRGLATRLRASVVQALDSKLNADRPGGNVPGALRPALIGVIVADEGTISSTEGANVDLPVGTILRIRIDKPLI